MSEIRSDVFEKCREINLLLNSGNEKDARNKLIEMLDFMQEREIPYNALVNHLIREVGLFPYFDENQAVSVPQRFMAAYHRIPLTVSYMILANE